MAPAQVEGPEAAYLPPRKLVDASFGAWSFTSSFLGCLQASWGHGNTIGPNGIQACVQA